MLQIGQTKGFFKKYVNSTPKCPGMVVEYALVLAYLSFLGVYIIT